MFLLEGMLFLAFVVVYWRWGLYRLRNLSRPEQPIKIKDTNLEEVEEFIYLGSIVNIEGGTDADVKNRINKARVIFNFLGSDKNISRGTKMPCGFHLRACLVILFGGFLSVWPIHAHFLFLICVFMGSWLQSQNWKSRDTTGTRQKI
jgi:hypothetical protein